MTCLKLLLCCPCGRTPKELRITGSGKWIDICGDCCGEWNIETKNNYARDEERMDNAIQAWNTATRGCKEINKKINYSGT